MARREFLTRLSQIAAVPFLARAVGAQTQPSKKALKIMIKSAGGRMIPLAHLSHLRMDWL